METLTISFLILTVLAGQCKPFFWYYDYSDSYDYGSWWPSSYDYGYDYKPPKPSGVITVTHDAQDSGPWKNKTDITSYSEQASVPFYDPPQIAITLDGRNLFNSHIDVKIPIEKKIENKEQYFDHRAINQDRRIDIHQEGHEKTSDVQNSDLHWRFG